MLIIHGQKLRRENDFSESHGGIMLSSAHVLMCWGAHDNQAAPNRSKVRALTEEGWCQQTFSVKGQTVSISGFEAVWTL